MDDDEFPAELITTLEEDELAFADCSSVEEAVVFGTLILGNGLAGPLADLCDVISKDSRGIGALFGMAPVSRDCDDERAGP